MTQQPKELMRITEFMEIYGIKLNRFYAETKKYPWLVTYIGPRSPRITRSNAEKWMEQIQKDSIPQP